MRRIIALTIAVVMVLSCVSLAFADSRIAGTRGVGKSSSLQFNGRTAVCTAYVSEYGSNCTISAELYQGSTLVAYWDDISMNQAAISGSFSGCISGKTYRLEVSATVNGRSIYFSPISKRCP